MELGVPGMSLPAALAPEGAVSSVLTQDTCCVHASPQSSARGRLPHPASRARTRVALGVFDGLESREPVWSSLTFVLVGVGTVVTEGWFSGCSFYWL